MARPRSDIQPRIVHAARARFLESGVEGASLRTIAADAGTNVGMISYYFPTKNDLFLAVVEEVYVELLDGIAAALEGDAPVRDRLERVFVRIGRATDDELAVVRLVVREALLSHERFSRVFARMQRGHIAMILATLRDGVARGEVDAGISPALLLLSCIGMGALPQLIRHAAGDQAPFASLPAPETLARSSTNLLFRAIGGPKRRASSRTAARSTQRRHRT